MVIRDLCLCYGVIFKLGMKLSAHPVIEPFASPRKRDR